MEESALIYMECPSCGKRHANMLAHLKAHWDQPFPCENGCGIEMKLNRDDLVAALEAPTPASPLVIKMRD